MDENENSMLEVPYEGVGRKIRERMVDERMPNL